MTDVDSDLTLLHRISGKLPYLATSLRRVAETILADPDRAQSFTISELAIHADVAESTVSRFVRELGLQGYKQLLRGLTEAQAAAGVARRNGYDGSTQLVYEGVAREDEVPTIVGKVARSSIQALQLTAEHQDAEAISRAVRLIDDARVIVFICMGSSSIAAEEAVMRFTRAGRKCLLFRDQTLQVMIASILDAEDLVIAISDSGQSTSVMEALDLANERGAKTIAITSDPDSPVARIAGLSLFTSNVPSGGELYGESVTSKWAQLLVVDILYAAYAAEHYDETVASLEVTWRNAIRQSRATQTSPEDEPVEPQPAETAAESSDSS